MSISNWAKEYCTQSPELMLLFEPEEQYSCASKALTNLLSHSTTNLSNFLRDLPADQYQHPNFSSFSLQVEHVSCIDNLYCYQFNHLKIDESSWKNFADTMGKLHAITRRISQVATLDELYQQSIIEAQQHLYLDRLAIFLLDTETNEMIGTWGTDQDGTVKDERGFRSPISDSPWVALTLASKENVQVWNDIDLLYYNKVVGKGWSAMAAIWDGDTAIGWIACDNLIKKRPLQPWLKEIIGQLGQALGHSIVRFNNLKKLKDINDNLESLVEQRSSQLKDKISLLEKTQNELIESEKLASLGSLVAGIAHEVNTPIGIGITAASHLVVQTQSINEHYVNKTMKKSQLDDYFHCAIESGEIIQDNLMRAGDLVKSFKQLAVDQSIDTSLDIDLKELIDNIKKSFQHQFKNKPIQFINHIDSALCIYSCPGKLNQIITNLVNNSLLHAFQSNLKGTIEIKAHIDKKTLHICYFDTGTGVENDALAKLFEPFFTTKRGKGGTGLGLNIVYNIIKKLDGQVALSHVKPSGLKFDITLPIKVTK
ncbi:sensor histidine kinase [Psychromonas sp. Urea-02u-13]|uniref:sensor histidine kinase n=1 Tax=Psychromonas sp. Urea-02u-13 TaxID=2058326 RepID=UPI0018E3C998|nr:HAMP domain-containing sensor histidine kinase [Psychromonas sp. Urea-02u-13]